jgi:rhamnogalacturonyl hydrolase YesR
MARTLMVLRDHDKAKPLLTSFAKLADWARKHQRADGLWSVFVEDPELAPDTAGSAGLAAAFAIGQREGWVDEHAGKSAARTLSRLKEYLAPDGFLRGAAQSNKGGESLQRGSYRVMYQMAMGLMGQLIAALDA